MHAAEVQIPHFPYPTGLPQYKFGYGCSTQTSITNANPTIRD